MRPRRIGAIAGIVIALAFGAPATAAASSAVAGSWVNTVPCLGISVPVSGGWRGFHCAGRSQWRGTWTGSTRYTADGAVNATTGDAHGTVVETFRGKTRDGRRGTLRFHERFAVDGTTRRVHREFELVEGGADFARMRGSGTFDGLMAGPLATGSYAGNWRLRPHKRRSPK
jgi:hypothetical protein